MEEIQKENEKIDGKVNHLVEEAVLEAYDGVLLNESEGKVCFSLLHLSSEALEFLQNPVLELHDDGLRELLLHYRIKDVLSLGEPLEEVGVELLFLLHIRKPNQLEHLLQVIELDLLHQSLQEQEPDSLLGILQVEDDFGGFEKAFERDFICSFIQEELEVVVEGVIELALIPAGSLENQLVLWVESRD